MIGGDQESALVIGGKELDSALVIGGEDPGASVSSHSLVNGYKEGHEDNQKRDKIEPSQETKVNSDTAKILESNGLQKFKAYHSIIPPPPPVTADTSHENEDITPSTFCSCFKQLHIGQEWLI